MVLLIIGAHFVAAGEKISLHVHEKKHIAFSFLLESTTSRDASSLTSIEKYAQQKEWQNNIIDPYFCNFNHFGEI